MYLFFAPNPQFKKKKELFCNPFDFWLHGERVGIEFVWRDEFNSQWEQQQKKSYKHIFHHWTNQLINERQQQMYIQIVNISSNQR